jgi:hypothetical protein
MSARLPQASPRPLPPVATAMLYQLKASVVLGGFTGIDISFVVWACVVSASLEWFDSVSSVERMKHASSLRTASDSENT